MHLSLSAIEREGRLTYVELIREISEQKDAEPHIERLAYYDALTGLPNRRLLRATGKRFKECMGEHGLVARP